MADAPEHYTPQNGIERVPQHSTLEPVYNNASGHHGSESSYVPVKMTDPNEHLAGGEEIKSQHKKKRICGLPKKTAIILGAILLLVVVVGAIVGGVLSLKQKTSGPPSGAVGGASSTASRSSPTTTSDSSSSKTTISSAAASSTAPALILPKGELFNSSIFHTISTYYGSDSAITRNITDASKSERKFFGIIGSFPSGGSIGSVGIVDWQPQFDDQRWHIMPATATQVPNPELYDSYGKQVPLMIITCQRYGPSVRLALDRSTPGAILTLAKQDDKQANQFWYTVQIEADIDGDYGRYALKNYEAGDDWHLGMGSQSKSLKRKAPLVKGKPSSDVDLWQIMPSEWLRETERAQWGIVD